MIKRPLLILLFPLILFFGGLYLFEFVHDQMNLIPMKEYSVVLPGGIVKKGEAPLESPEYTPDYRLEFPEIAHESDFNKLAGVLENADRLYRAHIGFTGSVSKEYACYQRLIQIGSEAQLKQLMRSKNPVVRAYAYDAMGYKSSSLQKAWQITLQNDTASFQVMAGCIVTEFTVAAYTRNEPKLFSKAN